MKHGVVRTGNLRQLPKSTTVGNDEEEWYDEEFDEFEQLMMGMAISSMPEEEQLDIVDALHGVVREVTSYNPEPRCKSKRLPTIGFIQ